MDLINSIISVEHRDILKCLIKYFDKEHYEILLVSNETFYSFFFKDRTLFDDYTDKKFGANERSDDLYRNAFIPDDIKISLIEVGAYEKLIDFLVCSSINQMKITFNNCYNNYPPTIPIGYILKLTSDVYILGDIKGKIYDKKKFYAHSLEEVLLTICNYYELVAYNQEEDVEVEIKYLLLNIIINTVGVKECYEVNIIDQIKKCISDSKYRCRMKDDYTNFNYPRKLK